MAKVKVVSYDEPFYRVSQMKVGSCFKLATGRSMGQVYRVLQVGLHDEANHYHQYSLCWSYDEDRIVSFYYSNKERRVKPVEVEEVTFRDVLTAPEPLIGLPVDKDEAEDGLDETQPAENR